MKKEPAWWPEAAIDCNRFFMLPADDPDFSAVADRINAQLLARAETVVHSRHLRLAPAEVCQGTMVRLYKTRLAFQLRLAKGPQRVPGSENALAFFDAVIRHECSTLRSQAIESTVPLDSAQLPYIEAGKKHWEVARDHALHAATTWFEEAKSPDQHRLRLFLWFNLFFPFDVKEEEAGGKAEKIVLMRLAYAIGHKSPSDIRKELADLSRKCWRLEQPHPKWTEESEDEPHCAMVRATLAALSPHDWIDVAPYSPERRWERARLKATSHHVEAEIRRKGGKKGQHRVRDMSSSGLAVLCPGFPMSTGLVTIRLETNGRSKTADVKGIVVDSDESSGVLRVVLHPDSCSSPGYQAILRDLSGQR